MGFLKKLGRKINKTVNKTVKNPTAFIIGGLPGVAVKEGLDAMAPKPPPAPNPNSALESLRQELSADAKNFRENIGGYKSQQVQGLLPTYDMAKEEGVRRTRENFGRRGLLYSGLQRKGEAETRGAVQSEFNQAVAGINKEAEQIATQKEKAAAGIGLEQMNQLMGQAEQYYNIAAENNIARRKALGNLASGLGYGAGAYFGNSAGGGKGLLASQQAQPQFAAFAPQPTSYGNLLGVNYGG